MGQGNSILISPAQTISKCLGVDDEELSNDMQWHSIPSKKHRNVSCEREALISLIASSDWCLLQSTVHLHSVDPNEMRITHKNIDCSLRQASLWLFQQWTKWEMSVTDTTIHAFQPISSRESIVLPLQVWWLQTVNIPSPVWQQEHSASLGSVSQSYILTLKVNCRLPSPNPHRNFRKCIRWMLQIQRPIVP